MPTPFSNQSVKICAMLFLSAKQAAINTQNNTANIDIEMLKQIIQEIIERK